jgi:aminoglycoside phosphotransferase
MVNNIKIENAELTKALRHYFGHSKPLDFELVQSLWGGYGAIIRYCSNQCDSKNIVQYCIAKVVNLQQQGQHPRGWNTNTSHQRKLSSYVNEQHFYRYFASLTNDECRVPKMFNASADDKSIWMILQDLNAEGFAKRSIHPSLSLVRLGVSWLANFHACFVNHSNLSNRKHLNKLWPIGTYWHLGTRADEWEAMPESPLKEAASEIDKRLNNANFQTVVHGDAKLANFCIHSTESMLAAVDFQYVGRGVGIKDFVYFLGSCFDSQALYEHAPSLLNEYFSSLKRATHKSSLNFEALEKEYRGLYAFAWADFERFLTGWSPGHKKLNDYSAEQTQFALQEIYT